MILTGEGIGAHILWIPPFQSWLLQKPAASCLRVFNTWESLPKGYFLGMVTSLAHAQINQKWWIVNDPQKQVMHGGIGGKAPQLPHPTAGMIWGVFHTVFQSPPVGPGSRFTLWQLAWSYMFYLHPPISCLNSLLLYSCFLNFLNKLIVILVSGSTSEGP